MVSVHLNERSYLGKEVCVCKYVRMLVLDIKRNHFEAEGGRKLEAGKENVIKMLSNSC